jgi:O-antigen ligase
MSFSFQQLLFILLFDILFLLLLLFGESFLGLYVIAGLIILFLFFWRKLDFSQLFCYKKIFLIWAFFLFSLIFSSFFTHSLPLTINALIFYAFAFLIFWFFLLLKPKFLSKDIILGNFLLITLVAIIMSVGFALRPEIGNLIPGMNLLFANYGHNHLSALLLLMISVSWYFFAKFDRKFFIKFKKWRISLLLLLPLILNLALLLTFARVAIFTGFVQFLVIVFLFYKKRAKLKKSKLLRFTLIFLGLTFFTILAVKMFFSLIVVVRPDFTCPVPAQYKTKICKNFSEEPRPLYWEQALTATKNYPLVGFGPGTFSLVNKKYRQTPHLGTGYAHNAFLEIISEGGLIVGGLFIVLMGYLLIQSFRKIPKFSQIKIEDPKIFLLLGLISIYFDVLFDFDWSFIGIFGLTLIFIALIIGDQPIKETGKKNHKLVLKFKIIYFAVSSVILALTAVYIFTEILIAQNKTKQAFEFFPYFQYHMILFVQSDQLSPPDKQKLFTIHQNNTAVYPFYKKTLNSEEERMALDFKLFTLDPWQKYFSYNQKHFDASSYEQAAKNLEEISILINKTLGKYNWEPNFEHTKKLAKLAVAAGDRYLLDGEYKKAGEVYLLARDLNYWGLSNSVPIFLQENKEPKNLNDLEIVLNELSDVSKDSWGWNQNSVANQRYHLLAKAIENKNLPEIEKQLLRIFEITPWKAWEIENNELKQMQKIADEFLAQENPQSDKDAEKILQLMSEYGAFWGKAQLGHFYMLRENDDLALKSYDQCLIDWRDFTAKWSEGKVEEQHDECFYAKEALENGWENRDRYHQASQIIRGEATWEDFIE